MWNLRTILSLQRREPRQRPCDMFVFVAFLLLLPGGSKAVDSDTGAFIAVRFLKNQEWPADKAVARLSFSQKGDKTCAASLLSRNLLVTAAHCVTNERVQEITALIGRERREFKVIKIIINPNYQVHFNRHNQSQELASYHEYYVNDIALLQLEQSVGCAHSLNFVLLPWSNKRAWTTCKFPPARPFKVYQNNCFLLAHGGHASYEERKDTSPSTSIAIICTLPSYFYEKPIITEPPFTEGHLFSNQSSVVAIVSQVAVDLFDKTHDPHMDCARPEWHGSKFVHGMICGGNKKEDNIVAGACLGDDGGALLCSEKGSSEPQLVGLVSWGNDCGKSKKPTVFTDVGAYQNWILQEINQDGALKAEFWNSLLECKRNLVELHECTDPFQRKLLQLEGIHCGSR